MAALVYTLFIFAGYAESMDLGFTRRAAAKGVPADLFALLARASSDQANSPTAAAQARTAHIPIDRLWPTPAAETLTSSWAQRSVRSGASFNPQAALTLSSSRKPS